MVSLKAVIPLVIGAVIAATTAHGARPQSPDRLTGLLANAGLSGTVAAWCKAAFLPGDAQDFAVALTTAKTSRYVALAADGRVSELAAFRGRADLACCDRRAAEALARSIRQSETIQGQVRPRWNTTVVCVSNHLKPRKSGQRRAPRAVAVVANPIARSLCQGRKPREAGSSEAESLERGEHEPPWVR